MEETIADGPRLGPNVSGAPINSVTTQGAGAHTTLPIHGPRIRTAHQALRVPIQGRQLLFVIPKSIKQQRCGRSDLGLPRPGCAAPHRCSARALAARSQGGWTGPLIIVALLAAHQQVCRQACNPASGLRCVHAPNLQAGDGIGDASEHLHPAGLRSDCAHMLAHPGLQASSWSPWTLMASSATPSARAACPPSRCAVRCDGKRACCPHGEARSRCSAAPPLAGARNAWPQGHIPGMCVQPTCPCSAPTTRAQAAAKVWPDVFGTPEAEARKGELVEKMRAVRPVVETG